MNTSDSTSRAYDRAAIKFRGLDADINFNVGDYEEDLKQVGCGCCAMVCIFFPFPQELLMMRTFLALLQR